MISKTITRVAALLASHPTPTFMILDDNLIVADNVPSHLVRRIRRYKHVISVSYRGYRLIVKVNEHTRRVSDSRISHVSTRRHEERINAHYQHLKEKSIYCPHRTPLGSALPSHRVRIGSTAKCVTSSGGLRPLH